MYICMYGYMYVGMCVCMYLGERSEPHTGLFNRDFA